MAYAECNLPRRQALAVAAVLAAFPTIAIGFPAEPKAQKDPIYDLLAQYRLLVGLYAAKAAEVDRLEDTVADDPAVRLYFYETEADLADFNETEKEQIRAGDLWSLASGHDKLVREMNEAGEQLTQVELALLTTKPRSVEAVVAVLEWLASKQSNPPAIVPLPPLEAADRDLYQHLADSLTALVST